MLLILAMILAGESPVCLMGEDSATAVAWTMRNRMEYWGHTIEQIQAAYYARGRPTDAEIEIVQQVFAADPTEDPTGGAFWAMSRQDVEAWGFPKGDLVFVSPKSAVYQIHLYRSNPFGHRHLLSRQGDKPQPKIDLAEFNW